jgi:hypothetical protein
MRICMKFALFSVAFVSTSPSAFSIDVPPGAIVYESLRIPAGGGHGFSEVTGLGREIGQSMTLAGTARHIAQIDLLLGSGASEQFRVRFYDLTEAGFPSTLIWESPVQTYPQTGSHFNRKTISVPVPNMLVPDSFAWTVAPLTPNNSTMIVLTAFSPPSAGTHLNDWALAGLSWRVNNFTGGQFGARLLAVPEYSSLALLAVGLLSSACTCARIRRRVRSARQF